MTNNEYIIFHAMTNQQFPSNNHDDGITDCGNNLARTKKEKIDWILNSLLEIGLFSFDERDAIKQILKPKPKKVYLNLFKKDNSSDVEIRSQPYDRKEDAESSSNCKGYIKTVELEE
jgi:hypothetical protein